MDARVQGIAYDVVGNAYLPVPIPTTGNISIYRDDPGPNPPELFVANLPYMYLGLAMDIVHGKLYWTGSWDEDDSGLIQCINLDGTGLQTLVTGEHLRSTDERHTLALDVDGGKMYWNSFGKIRRANLDGTNVEDFLTDVRAAAVAVEVPEPIVLVPAAITVLFLVGGHRRCAATLV